MNIYEKLDKARESIRNTPLKKTKSGGNFKYFTPEEVELLVAEACSEVKLLPLCSLKRNEFGLYQEMILVDLEAKSKTEEVIGLTTLTFELATEKGSLKNTNETQNMGSTDTYSERYIKMKVFQIKDNNLDPDGQQNHDKEKSVTPPTNNFQI
jgi:hypothetical protein